MDALSLRALLLLSAVIAAVAQTPVYTVVTSASIGNALPVPGDPVGYTYIEYCSADPAWDCNSNPDICTANCGTSAANGPQCDCPSVPADQSLDLADFPDQIRWGNPVPEGTDSGTGVPSGFGFHGIPSQGVFSASAEFLVGTAVHFNQPIWSSGSSCGGWDLQLHIEVTPAGSTQAVVGDFKYSLNLFETPNQCSGDGCPDSPWWAANPTALERPDCVTGSDGIPVLPNGDLCCPYVTTNGIPCSDKVWTLDTLDLSAAPIVINGAQYTLWIDGFSVPGQPSVRKTFFISQETDNTQAEIYGKLVVACPPQSTCPDPAQQPVLNADGTACVCVCPPSLSGPCANPAQVRGADCQCQCPAACTPPAVQQTDCSCLSPTTVPPPTTQPAPPSPTTQPPPPPTTAAPAPTTPAPAPTTVPPPPPGTTIPFVTTGTDTPLPTVSPTPSATPNATNTTAGHFVAPSSRGLSAGAVAGIVIGAIVAAALLAALVAFLILRGAVARPLNSRLLSAEEAGSAGDNPLWSPAGSSGNNPHYVQL